MTWEEERRTRWIAPMPLDAVRMQKAGGSRKNAGRTREEMKEEKEREGAL